jgi:hypothetical protein
VSAQVLVERSDSEGIWVVLSTMGGIGVRLVEIGRRSGSQTLLENRQTLVKTNIYLCISHLFYPNAWPTNIVLDIQADPRNPATNTSNPNPPLGDLVDPSRYPERLVSAFRLQRRGPVEKRQEQGGHGRNRMRLWGTWLVA